MARFCTKCGAELEENQNFCIICGAPVTPKGNNGSATTTTVSQNQPHIPNLKSVASTAGRMFGGSSSASAISGEAMIGGSAAGSLLGGTGAAILSPLKVIVGGLKSIKAGFKAALKNKKKLIPAIILALTWILLTLLPALGINPLPVKILSFLTFSQGGMSNNIIKMFGGILGKTIFATFVFSIFGGGNPLNKFKGYFKSFTGTFKAKDKLKIPVMLVGIAFSMIAFNFIVVSASPWSFMAGVATVYLSLKAMSGGFLRKLLTSIFAKFFKGKAALLSKNFLGGMTTGFAVSTAMGLFSLSYGPLILGILTLMVSGTWLLLAIVIIGNNTGAGGTVK